MGCLQPPGWPLCVAEFRTNSAIRTTVSCSYKLYVRPHHTETTFLYNELHKIPKHRTDTRIASLAHRCGGFTLGMLLTHLQAWHSQPCMLNYANRVHYWSHFKYEKRQPGHISSFFFFFCMPTGLPTLIYQAWQSNNQASKRYTSSSNKDSMERLLCH